MFAMIKAITLNDLSRFYKSLFLTSIAELAKFSTIFVVIYFVKRMLEPILGLQKPASLSELLLICVAGLASMLITYILSIPAYKASYEVTYAKSAQGRLALAEHIRKLPLGFLESSNPARLSHCLMKDFYNIEQASSHLLPQTIASLIVAFIVFIGLVIYHYQMGLAFFACVPLALLILVAIRKFASYLSSRHLEAQLQVSNHLNEYIDGISTIKAYNLGGARFKRLEKSFEHLRKESIRIEVGLMPFALTLLSCMGAGIGLMIGFGREFLVNGSLNVIEYIALILIGSKAFVPLMTFVMCFVEMQYFSKSGQQILDLLSQRQVQGSDKAIPTGNDIEIKNLNFSYDATPVLKNINLSIPAKSSLAIVGPSGSGKSTLVKLIARFYEPDSGGIFIGDKQSGDMKNIATLEPEMLMQKFSMVFQNVSLFKGSIASNVRFGKDDASLDEVETALSKANALEFVKALPQGIESAVSEGGNTLSGGEKQRICIARSILKDSPIILLDEITSSLDVYNEFAMQLALNALSHHKSIIIIAHKLKSVMNCDNIVFLQNGEIIAQGKHDDLLQNCKAYQTMWNLQMEH